MVQAGVGSCGHAVTNYLKHQLKELDSKYVVLHTKRRCASYFGLYNKLRYTTFLVLYVVGTCCTRIQIPACTVCISKGKKTKGTFVDNTNFATTLQLPHATRDHPAMTSEFAANVWNLKSNEDIGEAPLRTLIYPPAPQWMPGS